MLANRDRILHYPALVNCTTIDWFCEWPKEALLEVAERYLDGLDLGSFEGVRDACTSHNRFFTIKPVLFSPFFHRKRPNF